MKRCCYCGLENADESPTCTACGNSEFELARPAEQRQSNMRSRLALGLVAGLLVASISVIVAWNNTKEAEGLLWEQQLTRWHLRALQSAIESYRTNSGHLPTALNELKYSSGEPFAPTDPWNHPFAY